MYVVLHNINLDPAIPDIWVSIRHTEAFDHMLELDYKDPEKKDGKGKDDPKKEDEEAAAAAEA